MHHLQNLIELDLQVQAVAATTNGKPCCAHCGSPIRPLPGDPRVWTHATTQLPRCVGTPEIQVATPAIPQRRDGKAVA